jgi:hypothetical protein
MREPATSAGASGSLQADTAKQHSSPQPTEPACERTVHEQVPPKVEYATARQRTGPTRGSCAGAVRLGCGLADERGGIIEGHDDPASCSVEPTSGPHNSPKVC